MRQRCGLSDLIAATRALAPRDLLLTCPRREAFLSKDRRGTPMDAGCPVEGKFLWGPRASGAPARPSAQIIVFLYFRNSRFRQTEAHAINSPMTASISSPRATRSARAAGGRRATNPHRSDDFISLREPKKEKNGLGGRRNSLKRLNSAKEIQGFPSIVFGRAWLDLARFANIWIWLGTTTKLALASAAAALSTQADEGVSGRRPGRRRERIGASAPSNGAAWAFKPGRATP
jgi:hypothetical protein